MARGFNGTTDDINCGTTGDSVLQEDAAITISSWIRPDSAGEGGFGRIADRSGSVFGPAFMVRAATKLRFGADGSTDLVRESDNGVVDLTGVWQHALVTWDGGTTASNIHFYLDGVEPTYAITQNGSSIINNSAAVSMPWFPFPE